MFDQGFGELFVVRIAGNILAPSIVGSIEFAASQFGSRLVVVMGHTDCGAVAATVQALENGMGPASAHIRSITDRIAPKSSRSCETPPRTASLATPFAPTSVPPSISSATAGRILEELVLAGRLAIVGAEYEIESGTVHFFDRITDTR